MSKLIFRSPIEHIAAVKEYQLSGDDIQLRLAPLSLQLALLWDAQYHCVSLEDWGKIMTDVIKSMPKYTVDKFDCENFAMLTSARVSERYQLNTCGVAIGLSPWGEHGYNLLVANDGLIYFDPQTGDYIPIEDGSYKARLVIFGG